MVDLLRLERQILRGKGIEDALEKFDWKDFEQTVGDIFRQNDFRVSSNFRFKTKRRYENDLIAARGSLVFCVDCKRWAGGREKRWGIAKAAKEQQKRTEELRKFMKPNLIAKSLMRIPDGDFVPMIVTLHEESVLKEGETFVVPVKKLNTFILNSDALI